MKQKVSCQLRRRPDGEVSVIMIGKDGQVLDTRFFGKFTEKQFEQLFQVIRQEMPGTTVVEIELSGN
jgi:acylphosphatase